jgi:hypothetical protein
VDGALELGGTDVGGRVGPAELGKKGEDQEAACKVEDLVAAPQREREQ